MPQDKHPMRQALDWAKRAPDGQAAGHVLATAEQLLILQTHLNLALPVLLRTACRVARLDQHVLVVLVSSAAVATRLRHLEPDLVAHLIRKGWNVRQIRLKIQANNVEQALIKPDSTQSLHRSKRVLTPLVHKQFVDLSNRLNAGPLKDAVEKLLRKK